MKCCLGLLTVELHFGESRSLKDRRRIMNSVKERIRQRFNVSVAEADFGDVWQRGGLIISGAAVTPAAVEQCFRSLLSFLEEDPRILVISPQIRYYE
ncbi:DUF503 domain-containing protein [candidate division KSB1 bacterium]|nr:MAG: DUF503 domain-containing protein [candidate division KSB1 bacterium]